MDLRRLARKAAFDINSVSPLSNIRMTTFQVRAVVVAQLVERLLPTLEICGSNPIIGKILSTKLSTNCIIEKTKIKKKEWPILKKLQSGCK